MRFPPARHRPAPPGLASQTFFWLLGLGLLAGCAAYALLVLHSRSWPALAALRSSRDWHPRAYTETWCPRPYTQPEYQALRSWLGALAAVAGGLALGLARRRAGRAQLRGVGQQVAQRWRSLGAHWRALPKARRRLAVGLLLGLTGLRVLGSGLAQPYDDATSYELFVRAGLWAVTTFYPVPNNHVLATTLAWVFYQVHPGFWWSMRLPVLLASTLATVAWFGVLLRRGSFGVALLAVVSFSLTADGLYYAAVGRGYWLLIGLTAVGFEALLSLTQALQPGGRRPVQAAWAALVVSGVLGLFTVPSHGYFLASAYAWLGAVALRHRAWRGLGQLAVAATLTIVATGLLYTPLLWFSGAQSLLHNKFVIPLPCKEFWLAALAAGREPHHALGVGLALGVLVAFGWLAQRARAGRLPTAQRRLVRQLGWVSVALALLPYAVVVGQRLPPPERALLYKEQFLFVLLALVADDRWRRAATRPRLRRLALVLGVGLFGLSQLGLSVYREWTWRAAFRWHLGVPGADWLAAHAPGPVLAPLPLNQLLLRFYLPRMAPGQNWQIDDYPHPGVRYRYFVGQTGQPVAAETTLPVGQPAFHNALLTIYELP